MNILKWNTVTQTFLLKVLSHDLILRLDQTRAHNWEYTFMYVYKNLHRVVNITRHAICALARSDKRIQSTLHKA